MFFFFCFRSLKHIEIIWAEALCEIMFIHLPFRSHNVLRVDGLCRLCVCVAHLCELSIWINIFFYKQPLQSLHGLFFSFVQWIYVNQVPRTKNVKNTNSYHCCSNSFMSDHCNSDTHTCNFCWFCSFFFSCHVK